MSENLKEKYSLMFTSYPDIVDIAQMRKMLGNIGVTLAYKLLRQGTIKSIKIGREYKIPKSYIIQYLFETQQT
ncbi:MAG: helix-turn-helix domain-containing protein [Clostridia bacterium]|nr:helix-turn-helix domain-containing protein [Clostridia bacterium]